MTMKKVKEMNFVYPQNFPEIVKDLLEKILIENVEERWTLEEIKKHDFFDSIDWETLYEQSPPPFQPFPISLVFPDDGNGDTVDNSPTSQNNSSSPTPSRSYNEEEKKW